MAQRLTTHGLGGTASQFLRLGLGAGGGESGTVESGAVAGGAFSAVKGYSATFTGGAVADDSYTGFTPPPGHWASGAKAGGSFTWLKPGEIYVPPFIVANIARAVLTGAPDGVADLPLIIRSFSGSIRDAGEDQLTIVCPYVDGLPEAIDARPNGDLLLYIGTRDSAGTETLSQLIDVNLSDVRPDYGPRSWTITLAGYKGVTYDAPSAHTLPDSTYYSTTSGKRRVRTNGPIDSSIKPGDTVTVRGAVWTVGSLSYSASRGRAQTEIAEA